MNEDRTIKPSSKMDGKPENEKKPVPQHPVWLNPAEILLRLNPSGLLEGEIGGRKFEELSARAAFPFSKPDMFIELRTSDREYIGFVRNQNELTPESREAIRKSVAMQHFVPLIKRIGSIKGSHNCYTWKVSTDRGDTEFTSAGRRQNVEETGNDEYIVTDSEGNRYRIPSTPFLDGRSLAQLRKIL